MEFSNIAELTIIKFFIYSFFGYIIEVIYCSVPKRKLVNRGMLFGPYLPIYGFGAIAMIFFMHLVKTKNIFLIYLASVLITSCIEYLISYILEKIFQIKLWDYSKHKLNINGRVCALNSSLFGVLSLVLVYVVDVQVTHVLSYLSENVMMVLSHLIVIVLSVDTSLSVARLLNVKTKLKNIRYKLENKQEIDKDLKELRSELKAIIKKHPSLRIVGKRIKELNDRIR